jgi:hypothetical protein
VQRNQSAILSGRSEPHLDQVQHVHPESVKSEAGSNVGLRSVVLLPGKQSGKAKRSAALKKVNGFPYKKYTTSTEKEIAS